MHRIRFAICALALIGMAAPASAQGPIRNWLRSRRPSTEPQSVMPAATVTPTTTAGVGVGGTSTTGPVIGTPSTVIPATTTGPVIGTRPAVTPGPTTANYAPAGTTGGPTAGTIANVGVPTTQYASTSTGRRGLLFGRRRSAQQGIAPTTAPMIVPASGTSPTNLQPTPVPNTTPKPLPTTIGSTATPGVTPAVVTSATPTQEVSSSPTRTRNRLFAGRLGMRTRMMRG